VKASVEALLHSNETTWVEEYKFQRHDGGYTDVRDRAFVLRDADKKPIRIIGSMLDITQQKELERAKDRFISLVSHQLRTPLTSMRLLTEILAGSHAEELTPSQRDYGAQIESSTERMINLVNEILDVSNIESGRLHVRRADVDIQALIQGQIIEIIPLASEKHITIVYKPDTATQNVAVDPVLFGQIVHNLLTNAIRYTVEAHTIIQVSFQKTEKEYVFAVQDQGIGVPKEAWPRLFTSFYRANNAIKTQGDGSGLGLYLAKLILDMTGGKIWFKSVEGKGSTFYVSLPLDGMRDTHEGISRA
jgi:signal transduction histidine kinase